MIYNLIFDMGGVLMNHNVLGARQRLVELMGEDQVQSILGLLPNGEGTPQSMMEDFECGRILEDEFVDTLRRASKPGTNAQDIEDAWNIMHAGIPQDKLDRLRQWHNEGHHVLLLSNNNPIHYRDILTHYDLSMFDRCFFSHLLHAAKPDPVFFEIVLHYLHEQGWDTLPTVFVDDLLANRQAGEQFGWQTFDSLDSLHLNA